MPFKKGQSGNPSGLSSHDKEVMRKIRTAVNRGIDNMKSGKVVGVVALGEKITEALEDNAVATLRALAPLLPKDIFVETTSYTDASKITDAELADLIANRARAKRDEDQPNTLKDTG